MTQVTDPYIRIKLPDGVIEAYAKKAGSRQAAFHMLRCEALTKWRHNARTYNGARARELEQQRIAKQIENENQ